MGKIINLDELEKAINDIEKKYDIEDRKKLIEVLSKRIHNVEQGVKMESFTRKAVQSFPFGKFGDKLFGGEQ